MIHLTRTRTAQAVPAAFRGAGRIARELKLYQTRRDWLKAGTPAPFALESDWWKPAKPQLANEAGDKCAYCEASAKTVCHCDVEHVRPKAIYWWFALCYDNYVLACQLCNQTYKGDAYPIKGTRAAPPKISAQSSDASLQKLVGKAAPDPLEDAQAVTQKAFASAFQKEKPALIFPYLDQAEEFFSWEPDADQERVWICARAKSGSKRWRAEESIKTLGLNREELLRVRWQTYRPIELHCRIYASGLLDPQPALKTETAQMLIAAMETRQFFAGLCRWIIREKFKLPL